MTTMTGSISLKSENVWSNELNLASDRQRLLQLFAMHPIDKRSFR